MGAAHDSLNRLMGRFLFGRALTACFFPPAIAAALISVPAPPVNSLSRFQVFTPLRADSSGARYAPRVGFGLEFCSHFGTSPPDRRGGLTQKDAQARSSSEVTPSGDPQPRNRTSKPPSGSRSGPKEWEFSSRPSRLSRWRLMMAWLKMDGFRVEPGLGPAERQESRGGHAMRAAEPSYRVGS